MKNSFLPIYPTSAYGFMPLLGTALLTGIGHRAQAQAATDSLNRQRLTEVVVTATRSTTERRKVPQQIEVISRQDIQQTQALDFTDVVKKNASVDIIQYPGLLSGVGIRGFRPQTSGLNQRALLLVDGRPAGTSNLSTLDLGSVERVEVLKGPASALYGSQAMGGVVNVITRRSRGPVRSSVYTEYGSYETFRAGGAIGGNITEKLDFDLSFGLFDRAQDYKLGKQGVFRDWLDAKSATKTFTDGRSEETDDQRGDGSRRSFTKLNYYSGAFRVGYQVTKHWHVDARVERFVARNVQSPNDIFYGNAGPSTKDIERQNVEISAVGDYAHHQLLVRGYGSGEFNNNNTLPATAPAYRSFQSKNYWKGVQVKDVIKLGGQQVTVGVDHNEAVSRSHRFSATSAELAPFNPNYELNTTGLYVQGQLSLLNEKLIVMPGARYDFITYDVKSTPLLTTFTPGKETNPFFSPSLGAQYQVLEPLRVHGTIGRAYVTPDAYNVAGYSQTVNASNQASVTQGNPALKNENSVTWDAGLRFDKPEMGLTGDLTYFSTRVKDRITTRTTNPTGETTSEGYVVRSRTTYLNANDSQIHGLEAEVGYDFGAAQEYAHSLRVYAGGTRMLKAEDVVNNTDGSETRRGIQNVARFSHNFGVSYDNFKNLNARLSGRYVGRRRDTDFTDVNSPQILYPEYMTLDFSVTGTYAQHHALTLYVNNLTNENYYEKRGYNLPGRNVAARYTLTF
ncbi:TonB-dependent receptor [Hymenobacter volaticus]|uniref:TonB-dependent receptor n=1 Tax=Hymenobacter volaticus TaxID=2932254 RepID=A0ABY4GDM1_9BACT|nr:TonB-dependent receptor [Hymenobacter volaticus]UOQ68891.1 TonB-dependent receptor [Hymenobacter volaticus]